MFAFGWALGVGCGGAFVWFFKDPITLWYKGAEDQIGALNDKIKALREKL